MKKSSFIGALAALAALSSCSSNDEPTRIFLDGELRVSASIDQIKTRYSDTAFEVGDNMGVSGGDYSNVEFTTADGVTFTAASQKILIAQDATVNFSAYAPYDAAGGTISFSEPVDYLFAKAIDVAYSSPTAAFDFGHMMSKVKLTLKTDNNSAEKGIKITLNDVVKGGTFNTATGVATADVSQKGNMSVTSESNSASLILPPYDDTQSVKMGLSFNGKSYSATLQIPILRVGYQYTYEITIGNGGAVNTALQVTKPLLSEWTDDEDSPRPIEVEEAEDMNTEVGDFLLKDGSVLDQNSPRLNTLKNDIVGVIYYVKGDDSADLSNFGYEFNNGLAIALNNAGQGRFNKNNADYKTWCSDNADDVNGLYTTDMNVGGSGPKDNLFAGYNNTQIFLAAKDEATYSGSNDNIIKDTDSTYSNELLALLTTANENKVTNASDWYLPNFGEFYTITNNVEAINKSLAKAGGEALVKVENYERGSVNEGWYWTSTLRGTNIAWVSIIDNTEDILLNLYQTRNSNGKKGYFRFAVAF